jgi:hypothetical protein
MPPKNKAHIEGRRANVAALLLENKSERQIARELAISVNMAARDMQAVRAEWQERRLTDVGTWVAEEIKRLDVAMAAIWPQVYAGDEGAIRSMIALMERRSKYLGLDAKVEGLPAAQMQVVVLNGHGDALPDPDSLAAIWSSARAVPALPAGGGAERAGGDGEVSRVS